MPTEQADVRLRQRRAKGTVVERFQALVTVVALVPGEELRVTFKGTTYSAHLVPDGSGLMIEGQPKPVSPTAALGHLGEPGTAGISGAFERDGEWVRLETVRDRACERLELDWSAGT